MPRLASDCDPTGLALSPEEGFLLSRIDGHTSQALLGELTGMDADRVEQCLRRWIREGIVRVGVEGPPSAGPRNGAAVPPPALEPEDSDVPAIDPDLDISPEQQKEILAFEARLERPYYEILGVPADADARTIKRAYFSLSKEFHPDRYFRREIGPFAPRIERVFRKIVEAYELLSDPAVRAEIDRSLGAAADAAPEEEPAAAEHAPSRPRKPRRRPLSPFSPLGRLIAQRKAKAKSFFEAAMAAVNEERWLEATGSLRLAIAFDPGNATYRERFGEIQPRAHQIRFEALMKEADKAFSFKDRADALRIYEEALHFRPYDPTANHVAAKLAWLVAEDLRKAKEYAMRACEAEPEKAEYHRTLGQIYQAAGLKANARRELKLAVRLDPKDLEAKSALKSL